MLGALMLMLTCFVSGHRIVGEAGAEALRLKDRFNVSIPYLEHQALQL